MIPPPTINTNPSSSSNIIKRLFMKYTDLDEQKYSEKCIIALKIMDILSRTNMCSIEEYQKIKDLIEFTINNLNISVFKLDMMVNSNDKVSYDDSKNITKVFHQFINEERIEKETIRYKITDIQEILFKTSHKISEILHEVLLRNLLLNYFDD